MQTVIDLLNSYIDFKLVLLIIVSSYWVKKNFSDVLPKISLAHKIFIWATLITVVYYFILKSTGVFKVENVANYFISYFFATSFYELLVQPIVNWVTKLSSDNKPT